LPAVCPGDWRILAEIKRGTVAWKGSAAVSVARRDVEGVTVRMAPPFTVDGFVERDDPRPAYGERPPVTVILAPVDASPGHQASANERNDGSLHIANVYAGRYRIQSLGFIAGYYLESVRLGVTDVTGQVVDLAPGGPPIRVTYRSGAGRAVGLVENGWGSTLALAPKNETLLGLPFVRTAAPAPRRLLYLGLRPGGPERPVGRRFRTQSDGARRERARRAGRGRGNAEPESHCLAGVSPAALEGVTRESRRETRRRPAAERRRRRAGGGPTYSRSAAIFFSIARIRRACTSAGMEYASIPL
jgi:hypothetical protein